LLECRDALQDLFLLLQLALGLDAPFFDHAPALCETLAYLFDSLR
jgi:hypothetical protein